MNMRPIFRISGLLFGLLALSAPAAQAATVTRFVTSGTTASLNLVVSTAGARPDCTVDVWVVLDVSTALQSPNHTASTGALGFAQRLDNCTGEFEFGSFSAFLPSTAFTTASGTATLNATIPVTFDSFGAAGGTVTRTLVATLQYQKLENNSVASRSFSRQKAPGLLLITRSRGIFNAAGVTGQLTLDGANLLTAQSSIDSGIETASSATIDVTR
jgi:hypothetical protein